MTKMKTLTIGSTQYEVVDEASRQAIASDYSSSATYAVGDYVWYEGDLYKCVSEITTAEAWTSGHWTQVALADEVSEQSEQVSELKTAISDVDSAFNYEQVPLSMGASVQGYYMGTNGQPITGNASTFYIPVIIDSSLVKKEILVSGNLWWSMQPYVFVPTSGTPVNPELSGDGTVRKQIDLPFIPETTGTLYINYHTDNAVYGATVLTLKSLKNDKLPTDIVDDLIGVQNYRKLIFTTETGFYLNGQTGAITTTSGQEATISDYIPVVAGKTYLITTEHFWGQGMYAFFGSSKNYISGVSAANSGTLTKIWNNKVQAPNNAAYLVVAEWAQGNYPPITVYESVEKSISPYMKWAEKKWVCIGDSLTEQNTKAVMHYYDYISANTGIAPIIMGVSGSGYANNAGGSSAFYNRVSSIPSDANVITIFGSFNDLSSGLQLGTAEDSDTTTIAGCMNKTIENILSVIPTANIGIVAPTPWGTTRPSTSGDAYNYVEMLKSVAERWSLMFLDLWRHSGLRPWDSNFSAIAYPTGDAVHPNDIGQQIIAPKFKAFLETLLM